MAKKRKLTYRPQQPSLFDIPELRDTSQPEELPVHPAIANFIVNAPHHHSPSAPSHPILDEPIGPLSIPDTLTFISFGSGSSGNCTYIGSSSGEGFLIDAGVDPTKIIDGLRVNGLSMANVKGILLTHDHSDHVRYVYTLLRKHKDIFVYCTPKALSGIMRRHSISRRLKDYHKAIYKEFEFSLAGFTITAFDVSHDGTDNAGFFIQRGGFNFAVATDLGCITPRVDYYMGQAQFVMLESNYDAAMLAAGRYPPYLKARIKADNGHLDNMTTAAFLKQIYTPALRNVFLCHLSADNNTPELALAASRQALMEAGAPGIGDGSSSIEARRHSLQLVVLPRYDTLSHLLRL